MPKYPDQTRNLNPIPQAVIAMYIWHKEYAAQAKGSMDFWDDLTVQQRDICERALAEIRAAEQKH